MVEDLPIETSKQFETQTHVEKVSEGVDGQASKLVKDDQGQHGEKGGMAVFARNKARGYKVDDKGTCDG